MKLWSIFGRRKKLATRKESSASEAQPEPEVEIIRYRGGEVELRFEMSSASGGYNPPPKRPSGMDLPITERNWQASDAHLLLLSKYKTPQAVDRYSQSEGWEQVLGEHPTVAVRRFVRDGMLGVPGVAARLASSHTVARLKDLLRARELKVSGRKAELVARLMEADSDGMDEVTKDLTTVSWTDQGRRIAGSYLAQEKLRRLSAERHVLAALRARQFAQACQMVRVFEAGQVFARGMGVDWDDYDPSAQVAALEVIFSARPKILNRLEPEQVARLRTPAALAELWGTNTGKWMPKASGDEWAMEPDVAARMLIFHASYLRDMAWYREAGEKRVEMMGTDDDRGCTACRELTGKIFPIDEAPELPYEKCTAELGCRCRVSYGDLVLEWRAEGYEG